MIYYNGKLMRILSLAMIISFMCIYLCLELAFTFKQLDKVYYNYLLSRTCEVHEKSTF